MRRQAYIQVGEPQHPVAALDRGRRVLVHEGILIVALDYDKLRLLPQFPSSHTETFYKGKVYAHMVKDSVFFTIITACPLL